MAQRNSGYGRIANDLYVTPRWVYEALYRVEPWAEHAWDCAPINAEFNFLDIIPGVNVFNKPRGFEDIATNPPFNRAEAFVRHAVKHASKVAMLLPYTFDAAKGRVDLFSYPFKARYNITKRIRWENLEQKKSGPSQNHAWYVWDKSSYEVPMIGWLNG